LHFPVTVEDFERPYYGKENRKIFTLKEANEYLKSKQQLITQSSSTWGVHFYCNDHLFSAVRDKGEETQWILPEYFCPSTHQLTQGRRHVVPRAGLEDGVLDSVEKYEFIFHHDSRLLTTLEELIHFINAEQPKMAKEIALKMLRNKPKGVTYQDNFLGGSVHLMLADKRIPISKIVVDKSGSIYRLHGYRYECGDVYWHSREMVEAGHQYCLRVTTTYGSLKRKNKNLKHIQTRLDKKAEKRLRESVIRYIERK
jgi:hypothetical protein